MNIVKMALLFSFFSIFFAGAMVPALVELSVHHSHGLAHANAHAQGSLPVKAQKQMSGQEFLCSLDMLPDFSPHTLYRSIGRVKQSPVCNGLLKQLKQEGWADSERSSSGMQPEELVPRLQKLVRIAACKGDVEALALVHKIAQTIGSDNIFVDNQAENFGDITPALHVAALSLQPGAVKYLLENGCKSTVKAPILYFFNDAGKRASLAPDQALSAVYADSRYSDDDQSDGDESYELSSDTCLAELFERMLLKDMKEKVTLANARAAAQIITLLQKKLLSEAADLASVPAAQNADEHVSELFKKPVEGEDYSESGESDMQERDAVFQARDLARRDSLDQYPEIEDDYAYGFDMQSPAVSPVRAPTPSLVEMPESVQKQEKQKKEPFWKRCWCCGGKKRTPSRRDLLQDDVQE